MYYIHHQYIGIVIHRLYKNIENDYFYGDDIYKFIENGKINIFVVSKHELFKVFFTFSRSSSHYSVAFHIIKYYIILSKL